jgi:integrase
VVEAFEKQRRRQAETVGPREYVFTSEAGTMLDPKNVTRSFQRHLALAGLPRMRFHDLRHAYATISLAAGVQLRVIQEALGHTSIALTAAVYAHVLPSLQQDAGTRLEEALRR